MDIVQAYNNQDFAVMAEWYLLNGENSILRMQMQDDLDDYLKQRLIEELSPLIPKMTKSRREKTFDDKMKDKPKAVRDVYAQAKEYFKKMKEARVGVGDADGNKTRFGIFDDDKEVRRLAAFEVKRLARLNKECWMDINHYDRFGFLPSKLSDDDKVNVMSVEEAVKQRTLDENYVYKFSKKLKSLSGEEYQELAEKVKFRQNRISLIDKKIALL